MYKCKLCGHKTNCKERAKLHVHVRHNIEHAKTSKFVKKVKKK